MSECNVIMENFTTALQAYVISPFNLASWHPSQSKHIANARESILPSSVKTNDK